MRFKTAFLAALLMAGPFCFAQKIHVDWRTTMHLNLGVDCAQTLLFPSRDIRETNGIAKAFQKTLGYSTGTVAYFVLASVLLDTLGRDQRWVYPLVTLIQVKTILGNRRLGVGGIPLIWVNFKF